MFFFVIVVVVVFNALPLYIPYDNTTTEPFNSNQYPGFGIDQVVDSPLKLD